MAGSGVGKLRLSKGQKLYQGRPKFSIESVARSNWSGMSLVGTNVSPTEPSPPKTPKRTRPFASTNGNFDPAPIPTPSPKSAEDVANGQEGPPANPRSRL